MLSQKQISEILLVFLKDMGIWKNQITGEYSFTPDCGGDFCEGQVIDGCNKAKECRILAKIVNILNGEGD